MADFYCGSGTTPAVAARLGRRWIASDSSPVAIATTAQRLAAAQTSRSAAAEPVRPFSLLRNADEPQSPSVPTRASASIHSANEVRTVHLQTGDNEPGPNAPIRYWAVDWTHGARRNEQGNPVFHHQCWRARPADRETLELISDPQPPAEQGPPMVKLIDARGEECLVPLPDL